MIDHLMCLVGFDVFASYQRSKVGCTIWSFERIQHQELIMQLVVVGFVAALLFLYVVRAAFVHGHRSRQMPPGEG